jgi:hypothetical protein
MINRTKTPFASMAEGVFLLGLIEIYDKWQKNAPYFNEGMNFARSYYFSRDMK